MDEITVHDIECKIQERIDLLEEQDDRVRVKELCLLLNFIQSGENY